MKSDYNFEHADAKKIGSLVDTPPKKIKKNKPDCDFTYVDKEEIDKVLTDDYINKHNEKAKKGKEYDLIGQMPERMQKRYFDAIKNK